MKLKKYIAVTLLACLLATLLCGCFGATCENCKVSTEYEDRIYVNPVCPDCGHINKTVELRLTKGEGKRGSVVCESCDRMYEVSVQR